MAFIHALAQEPIEVKIEQRPSSLGIHPAFEVVIPQATSDLAIDVLKKDYLPGGFLKKNTKVEKEKDEWLVDKVVLEDITSGPLDVITQVSSFPGHIYVRFFFRDGEGFLGSEEASSPVTDAASRFVRNYGVKVYARAVEEELKTEEKELKKLENDRDKLISRNKNYDDRIDDAKKDQKEIDDETSYQRNDLREAKRSSGIGSEQLDEMEKELKTTEKELKKAKKEEARFDRKVSKNEKEQREIIRAIEIQEEKVEQVKQKLENIR
jgi:hypothetical protein